MRKLLLFTLGICLFASCSKNLDTNGPIDASKQKMLMSAKSWQLRAFTLNPHLEDTNSVAYSIYNTIPDCQKDNYYIFNSQTTVSLYDHYLKCTLSEPDTIAYSYSLTNNEKHLKVWSDPHDPQNSIVMEGDMTYPSIDTFILTYETYDANADSTAQYVKTFVRYTPN